MAGEGKGIRVLKSYSDDFWTFPFLSFGFQAVAEPLGLLLHWAVPSPPEVLDWGLLTGPHHGDPYLVLVALVLHCPAGDCPFAPPTSLECPHHRAHPPSYLGPISIPIGKVGTLRQREVLVKCPVNNDLYPASADST